MSITGGGGACRLIFLFFFFIFRNISREVDSEDLSDSSVGLLFFFFFSFYTPRSPARLFESRSHLNPLPKTYCRLNMLRVLRDYHTKFAHSVSTISFLFSFFSSFGLRTRSHIYRNIVFFFFYALLHALPLSPVVYR